MKISIDNIAYGGYGVGRLEGKAVFIDCALPGDELEIEIYEDRKNYSFARYTQILTPSDKRVQPECPNFGICGGCSYLNLNYPDELEFKRSILADQLKRIASIELSSEIKILSDERYHYRSHSSIKCDGAVSGFYGRGSNDIVPFPGAGCLLLADSLIEGVKLLKVKDIHGDLKIAENWHGEFHFDNADNPVIEERVGDFYYRRDINSFFQSNKFLRKQMSDLVCAYSGLNLEDEFADICAGCGFFTIPLSRKASHGTGYDIDRKSIEAAGKNAIFNKCTNLKFYSLPESEINPVRLNPKTIVVDPPRSGISKRGRKTINAINPEIIVYVSCNPSTYSRDIIDFYKNGYVISEITMIDMFPCTHHIEVVSKLTKKNYRCP